MSGFYDFYDVAVVGAGHAGTEAALACARMGLKTVLITQTPDAIARMSYPIDIHNPVGSGTFLKFIAPNDYYEISYRAIVPQNSVNLLVGCRSISIDHALYSSCRVMPQVCAIGEGAGVAAALILANGCKATELDGQLVNARLKEIGAL